ncbi:hypothetical protein L6164_011466 [Bauhinia variegata]|uniref:Uncharacterized protein n=1 Tax=Bauhinia variegata TaxID=167791 RepID=A0ACB9P645_BAUVA|nr:hypothetical protein L6164_011466 [Bauhinia variegata]
MAKLKIAGIWAGAVEVDLDTWTVSMLREEIAKLSNCVPDSLKLICGGKIFKDGDAQENLRQLGIKNNAKVLASRVCVEESKSSMMAEEERSSRLARVKAAATALAKRHEDSSLPVEDFNIEVEDQSGRKVNLGSETDQRAVMMGLMLHANGKSLIRQEKYNDALEVLSMAEESFSLCDPKVIELIDNIPILQIDMVWCYFMIRDIKWLSVAGERLVKARAGIERAHGKDSIRLRLLQGSCYPELALHLRLELLEGVVAYHSGRLDKSKEAMTSAKAKFLQLQVPDEALSLVMSMGFDELASKRALRMNNQDVGAAVDFLVEERAKRIKKRKENIQRRKEIMEQKRYGVTPSKKAVNLQRLNEFASIGFEKELAAEALRRNENDTQKALDDLTNPETNSAIQVHIESRKRKRQKQAEEIENFVRAGFERSTVAAAFRAAVGNSDEVMRRLTAQPPAGNNNVHPEANSSAFPRDMASSSARLPNNIDDQRDVEMEGELSKEIANADALADYDIEITIEGEAISEYLALLESAVSQ